MKDPSTIKLHRTRSVNNRSSRELLPAQNRVKQATQSEAYKQRAKICASRLSCLLLLLPVFQTVCRLAAFMKTQRNDSSWFPKHVGLHGSEHSNQPTATQIPSTRGCQLFSQDSMSLCRKTKPWSGAHFRLKPTRKLLNGYVTCVNTPPPRMDGLPLGSL